MAASESDRGAIKSLIVDILALRMASELSGFTLPTKREFDKHRGYVDAKAELILINYGKELQVETVANAVIDKLKGELARRSRVSGIVEIATNVCSLLIGALAGCVSIFLDPAANASAVRAICFGVTGIVLIQFVANLYLRYFDHDR